MSQNIPSTYEIASVAQHALTSRLRQRAQTVNALGGLAALPGLVVHRLAEHLTLCDRISLARVSHALRGHMLRAPRLWARVSATRPAMLSTVLTHSSAHPLDITLRIGLTDVGVVVALQPHMFRVRSLSITFDNWSGADCLGSHVENLLCSPAPLLEKLVLVDADRYSIDAISPPELPDNIFGYEPAKLRELTLRGVRLPGRCICPALLGVENFEYRPPLGHRLLSPQVMDGVLAFFPRLRSISLNYDDFMPDITRSNLSQTIEEVRLDLAYDAIDLLNYFQPVRNLDVTVRSASMVLDDDTVPPLMLTRADMGMHSARAHFTGPGVAPPKC